jgi:hypothetical protein
MKIYLGIPYTGTEEASFKLANQVAGKLMKEGHVVYSPISHCHPIAKQCGLPTDWEYWKENGEAFIGWCDALFIITAEGWTISTGLIAEGRIAHNLNKMVTYIDPETHEKVK